jgi:hypothetical protein
VVCCYALGDKEGMRSAFTRLMQVGVAPSQLLPASVAEEGVDLGGQQSNWFQSSAMG